MEDPNYINSRSQNTIPVSGEILVNLNTRLITIFKKKIIFISILSTILTACSTPNQNDFEKEVAGRVENGMPVQEAILRLKDFGFTCTKYPKYFDCSRTKQRVIPPVSCVERITFAQNEQGLASETTIWKLACAGF